MAEEAINRRKSHLFLNNISKVTNSYDELVKEKLEGGRFPTTATGILQMTGMLLLLFSVSFFLAQPICENTPDYYAYLFPISVLITLGAQATFYLIFSVGCTVSRPGFWIYFNIAVVMVLSVITVICSALTYRDCNEEGTEKTIPGPCGMVGGAVLVISCGSIFLLYRYVEDDDETADNNTKQQNSVPDSRKSVFA